MIEGGAKAPDTESPSRMYRKKSNSRHWNASNDRNEGLNDVHYLSDFILRYPRSQFAIKNDKNAKITLQSSTGLSVWHIFFICFSLFNLAAFGDSNTMKKLHASQAEKKQQQVSLQKDLFVQIKKNLHEIPSLSLDYARCEIFLA